MPLIAYANGVDAPVATHLESVACWLWIRFPLGDWAVAHIQSPPAQPDECVGMRGGRIGQHAPVAVQGPREQVLVFAVGSAAIES